MKEAHVRGAHIRVAMSVALVLASVASLLSLSAPAAMAMEAPAVVINEIVAANDSFVDAFGDTPDWIELQNNESEAVDLTGWTIADNSGPWLFPTVSIGPGERLVVFASNRDITTPQLHTDFALKRSGETVVLADNTGLLVDSISYPALDDDQAYGRDSSGDVGFLLSATPGTTNTALAPSSVSIVTPPQTFQDSLVVTLDAVTAAGEVVRYTTNSSPVSASSPIYSSPFTISTSTVVRAAVTGNGVVGPESSAGYIAISSSIANFSSDIPIVLVHSTGAVGEDTQDAIVTVIDRAADGRASVLGDADYTGFAGLRIRGATSVNFPKKQYKFELWGNRLGEEIDADLLGLGSDSDWGLYAPGYYDRAMINNPLMYELAKRTGVVSPDYQFVELYIEDNPSATVGSGDYLGLFVLRETIKIDDERVDIVKHTSSSSGPDGGYIVRYDWNDECCRNIAQTRFGSYVNVDSPKLTDLTTNQYDYIENWWFDLSEAANTSFADADQYIDFESLIDGWLLEILAMDVDVLRASHYFHKDAGGQLRAGPLWDYDRSLGGADPRVNSIAEAQAWEPNGRSGHSYRSDVYEDLWGMPEVQARLRGRWAELRGPGGVFSDVELETLIFQLGGEIAEAYVREDARWGLVTGYGSRYGDLNGELSHMRDWLNARTAWLDGQFLSANSPPQVVNPGGFTIEENVPFSYQVQATDSQSMVYAATGLPEGLSIDQSTGLISGTVAYGDGWTSPRVDVTVTDSSGAATTISFVMTGQGFTDPVRIQLNEYNAVAPGAFLVDGGTDATFGTVGGNGGDWFEVVTTIDRLDLRGWSFDLWSEEQGEIVQTARLELGQDALLSDIRAGTIITVAESVPEDLSYDPAADDWTLNLQANSAGDGTLWVNQTNFDTNNKKWRLVIRDATGALASPFVVGETAIFRAIEGNTVADDEVFILNIDPSSALADNGVHASSSQSTFGAANVIDGGVQDLSALRPVLTLLGDVNCSDSINVGDALIIAQYTVGNRTDSGGCPLSDPATQLNVAGADVSGDGRVNIADALFIAQCTVGNPNPFCPD